MCSFGTDDERSGEFAKLNQVNPVSAVARQVLHLDAINGTDIA
jgi:hypothetical protein